MLKDVVEDLGYDDAIQACEEEQWVMDGIIPGTCRQCDFINDSVEPDARDYPCPECETNTVDSVLILMEIM